VLLVHEDAIHVDQVVFDRPHIRGAIVPDHRVACRGGAAGCEERPPAGLRPRRSLCAVNWQWAGCRNVDLGLCVCCFADFSFGGGHVTRRRNDYPTWDELSPVERRRGLAILGVIGVATVILMYVVLGDAGSTGGAEAGAPAPPAAGPPATSAADGEATADAGPGDWYAATANIRTQVTSAAAEVRRWVAANDGRALQPACALLATRAASAGAVPAAPVATARQAWSDGVGSYARAARWCGQLFDGTRMAPPTLLARTTAALNGADRRFAALAASVGQRTPAGAPASAGRSG
jgi:hypothetical protein